MKRHADQSSHGFLSLEAYAAKYGMSSGAVSHLVRRGRLKSYKARASGSNEASRFVEDKFVSRVNIDKRILDGKKLCSSCNSWLSEEHYRPSEWKRGKGPCAVCSRANMQRLRGKGSPELDKLIIASNSEAEVDRRLMTEEMRAEHERRIQAHAERIEQEEQQQQGNDNDHRNY